MQRPETPRHAPAIHGSLAAWLPPKAIEPTPKTGGRPGSTASGLLPWKRRHTAHPPDRRGPGRRRMRHRPLDGGDACCQGDYRRPGGGPFTAGIDGLDETRRMIGGDDDETDSHMGRRRRAGRPRRGQGDRRRRAHDGGEDDDGTEDREGRDGHASSSHSRDPPRRVESRTHAAGPGAPGYAAAPAPPTGPAPTGNATAQAIPCNATAQATPRSVGPTRRTAPARAARKHGATTRPPPTHPATSRHRSPPTHHRQRHRTAIPATINPPDRHTGTHAEPGTDVAAHDGPRRDRTDELPAAVRREGTPDAAATTSTRMDMHDRPPMDVGAHDDYDDDMQAPPPSAPSPRTPTRLYRAPPRANNPSRPGTPSPIAQQRQCRDGEGASSQKHLRPMTAHFGMDVDATDTRRPDDDAIDEDLLEATSPHDEPRQPLPTEASRAHQRKAERRRSSSATWSWPHSPLWLRHRPQRQRGHHNP